MRQSLRFEFALTYSDRLTILLRRFLDPEEKLAHITSGFFKGQGRDFTEFRHLQQCYSVAIIGPVALRFFNTDDTMASDCLNLYIQEKCGGIAVLRVCRWFVSKGYRPLSAHYQHEVERRGECINRVLCTRALRHVGRNVPNNDKGVYAFENRRGLRIIVVVSPCTIPEACLVLPGSELSSKLLRNLSSLK